MKHNLYAYHKTNGVYVKYQVGTLNFEDCERAKNPQEFFGSFIQGRRLVFEKETDKIIEEWEKNALPLSKRYREISSLVNASASRIQKLNTNALTNILDKYYALSKIIYSDSSTFFANVFYMRAPADIKNRYPSFTDGLGHKWLLNFDRTLEEQSSLKNIRREILEKDYKTFTKDEAKEVVRLIRDKFVRNAEDSIADAFKLCSFLAGAMRRMYSVIPEEQKDNLSKADRSMLETGLDYQSAYNTRGDAQFHQDGSKFLKRLVARESEINAIINLVYENIKD